MPGRQLTYQWFALYTKSRNEKKVYTQLVNQGIECFLPLETKLKQWSDRKKKVEEPMIKSYVFVKSSEKEYYDILNTPGAVRYVTFEGKAAPIPDWQIDVMRRMVELDEPHHYSASFFKKGDLVEIDEGTLKGFKGEIIRDNEGKQRIIIRIENIGYSMVVETNVNNIRLTNDK
ncbi:MAG: antitermination protein NusG [Bacteroidetes bacterium]|nr:antitermination protein NusG [Bacteroidota bacterium]